MKKIVFMLAAMAVLSLSACKNGKAPADKQSVTKVETTITFDSVSSDVGLLKEEELRNVHFTFTNTGDKPLVLNQVQGHCSCTIVAYSKAPVQPGATGDITVAIRGSYLKHGHFNKTVDVYSNGSEQPIELTLTGEFDGPDSAEEMQEVQEKQKE